MSDESQDLDLEDSKTLKVTLPAEMHLRLHSMKILTGQNISETVEEAVERFLEEDLDIDAPLLPGDVDRP